MKRIILALSLKRVTQVVLLTLTLLLSGCQMKGKESVVLTLDRSILESGNRLLDGLIIHFNTGSIFQEKKYVNGRVIFTDLNPTSNFAIALRFINKNNEYGLYTCQYKATPKTPLFFYYFGQLILVHVKSLSVQNGVGVADCVYRDQM